ncbi:MAG: pyrroline-5-carboxylate reductase [Sphingobium sp.]|nr:pyrroline-5-carboxylate reductase [Sphingobium sp.]
MRRLWLVGCGNMAGAMLRQWLASGTLALADVVIANRTDRDLPPGVAQGRAFPEGPLPDAVLLAMKPQQIDEVAARHGAAIAGVPLLISILAGVEEAAVARRFGAGAIVRAMPNLPVGIGKGVVALHSDSAPAPARADVAALMAPLGLVEWVAPDLFDAVTALAGSGPGFLYRYIDAMTAAAAAIGIPVDQAARLALATVEGSALLAAAADAPPAVLADRVASPGGSTRKGLDVLDRDAALVRLLTETLEAATARNAEMAAAAR